MPSEVAYVFGDLEQYHVNDLRRDAGHNLLPSSPPLLDGDIILDEIEDERFAPEICVYGARRATSFRVVRDVR